MPLTFGHRIAASTNIQASKINVATPTPITTQFGCSARNQVGSSLSIAHAGMINMKIIGTTMNQTGMPRRHKKNGDHEKGESGQ